MKGQLVFEFIIAAIIFIGIIVFVLNILNANVSIFSSEYQAYNLESKAIAASEAFVRTASGVGVALDWPVLDPDKLTELVVLDMDGNANGLCNDIDNQYDTLLSLLNLVERPGLQNTYNVNIEVDKLDDSFNYLNCGKTFPEGVFSASIERFAILEGAPVRVVVNVW